MAVKALGSRTSCAYGSHRGDRVDAGAFVLKEGAAYDGAAPSQTDDAKTDAVVGSRNASIGAGAHRCGSRSAGVEKISAIHRGTLSGSENTA